jgi:hypothetical protein
MTLFQADRPPALSGRVHSLVLPVLYGVLRLPSCVAIADDDLPWGFLPSSRCSRRSPRFAGFPFPAAFRPQVFSTSRRFTPPPVLRASFIPLPRPGFPFRGLVPTRSCADSSPACAPLPFPCSRSPVARLPRSHIELRGFRPRSEAIVEVGGWPSTTPLPSSVFPPPGSRFRIARPNHYDAAAPLVIFSPARSPSRCRSGARSGDDLQRVSNPSAGGSSPSSPTCSRFVPSAGPFTC